MKQQKSSLIFFVVLLVLVLSSSLSFAFTPKSDDDAGYNVPSSSSGNDIGSATKFLGDNVLKKIFVDASETGFRKANIFWFRVAFFLILVAVIIVAARNTGRMTHKGATVVVVIISFISSIFLSADNLLFLFDLTVFCIIAGTMIWFLKWFLEKTNIMHSGTILGIILILLGIFLIDVANGNRLVNFPIVEYITGNQIGKIALFLAGIFCIIWGIILLIPKGMKDWGRGVAGNFNNPLLNKLMPAKAGIAPVLPEIGSHIDRLEDALKRAKTAGISSQDAQRILSQIRELKGELRRKEKELDLIDLGAN